MTDGMKIFTKTATYGIIFQKQGINIGIELNEIKEEFKMDEKLDVKQERHVAILDALLGDADLMMAVNAAPNFEAGYEMVAEKVPGLTLEEFTASMDLLKQMVLAQMEKTQIQ
ncbi:hypothetical protein [Acetobacterium bakii]|nr:hypothetical protein [Acetobacterium bakii]